MFSKLLKAQNEKGSAYIVVMLVVVVGFIATTSLTASAFFSSAQTSKGRDNVSATAAAEAGRDVVLGDFLAAANYKPEWCTLPGSDNPPAGRPGAAEPGTLTDGSTYTTKVFYTNIQASALTPDKLKPAIPNADISRGCPQADSKSVIIESTGTSEDGQSKTIVAIFEYRAASEKTALTGMHYNGFTVNRSTYTGDQVVANGDFFCGNGAVIDGDVIVLNGNATSWPGSVAGSDRTCRIKGDLRVSGNIKSTSSAGFFTSLDNAASLIVEGSVVAGGNFTADLGIRVGGTVQVNGDVDIETYGWLLGLAKAKTEIGSDFAASPLTTPVIWAGGHVKLRDNGGPGYVHGGVRAASYVKGEDDWYVKGDVESGDYIQLDGVSDVKSVTARQNITTSNSSIAGNMWTGQSATVSNTNVAGEIKAVGDITKTGGNSPTQDLKSGGKITMSSGEARNLQAYGPITKTGGQVYGDAWSRTSVSNSGGTIRGEVKSKGTASFSSGTVGAITANGNVVADNGTIGYGGSSGDIKSGGNVDSTGTQGLTVKGGVQAAGSVIAKEGFVVGRGVAANDDVKITQSGSKSTSIGYSDSVVGIQAGKKVELLRTCANDDVLTQQASDRWGKVRGDVQAGTSVKIERCWKVESGTVRSDSLTVEPGLPLYQCRERKNRGVWWLFGGWKYDGWIPNTLDTTVWPLRGTPDVKTSAQQDCWNRWVYDYLSATAGWDYQAVWVINSSLDKVGTSIAATGAGVTIPVVAAPTVGDTPDVVPPPDFVPPPPAIFEKVNWMDLPDTGPWTGYGTTADVGPAPTFVETPTYFKAEAGDCTPKSTWITDILGWIGIDAKDFLYASKAEAFLLGKLNQPGEPLLVDTTACSKPLNLNFSMTGWGTQNVRRDAVILVKNYTATTMSYNAPSPARDCTAGELSANPETCSSLAGSANSAPRRLFIVQPDNVADNAPTCPTGWKPLELGLSGAWGSASKVHIMYYAPCGISAKGPIGTGAVTLYGQMYTSGFGNAGQPNGFFDISGAFSDIKCRPMRMPDNFYLGCDYKPGSDQLGNATVPEVVSAFFGDSPTFQTE